MAAGCVFRAGDTCEGDACLANSGPTARIRGVDDLGNLRVGARTTVIISAADSADADLDPLTYAWTVGASCASSVVGTTDAVELRLAGLVAGSDCGVTLTVSDGTSADSATAQLVIRDVGAHVSAAFPCAPAYEPASDAPQGTPEIPFCRVGTALLAAADYQLAEVSIAIGAPQQLDTDLLIDRGVTLRGGYARLATAWGAPTAATRSELALSATSAQSSDPRIRVAATSPSDTVVLANLAIYRLTPCQGECALVDATATSLTLDKVELGKSPTIDPANVGASDAVYYSVRASGGGASPLLSTNLVGIQGASSGFGSVGLMLTDGMDAVLAATTIVEDSHTANGVRLVDAGDVRIEGSSITVRSDAETPDEARSPSSLAFGIADGNASALDIGGCAAAPGATCGGAKSLTLVGTAVNVARARLAIAVAALGTRTVAFLAPGSVTRSTLTASGRQAYGLLTMGTGDETSGTPGLTCEGVNIDVTVTASIGAPASAAAGWSDGYETGAPDLASVALELGSYGAVLGNAVITVKVGSAFVAEAAGIVLRGSRESRIANVAVNVAPAPGAIPVNGWTVGRLAGIRLMRTNKVALEGGTVGITGLAASWIAGALVDGQMSLANDDIATGVDGEDHGSAELSVQGTSFAGALSVNNIGEVPLRACVGLFGTDAATIADTTVACQLGTSENESVPTMAGVVTLLTRDVTLADSVVRVEDATTTSAVRLLGIQDGSRLASTLGSQGLRIARNIVTVDAPSTVAVGVRLSGNYGSAAPPPDDVAVIDNNVIRVMQSAANVGVLVFTTPATIAFNNVRVATCTTPSCTNSFATGFYLMHVARAEPVLLLANAFSVADATFGDGDLDAAPFAVEHANTSELGLTALVDNLHGVESSNSGSPLLVRFLDVSDESLVPPQTYDPLDEGGINALFAGTAEGNHPAPPTYCPDAIHGSPYGQQAGRVTHVTSIPITSLRDIDGEERVLAGADAGADVLGPCP